MHYKEIIGKSDDNQFCNISIDYVDFEWHEIYKKLHKKTSRGSKEIALSLDNYILTQGLRDGDVLGKDDNTIFVVNILPCEVLIITADPHLIPKICYEIGNKHAALFYGESQDEFVTPYNEPARILLEKIGASVSVKTVKLNQGRSISSTVNLHAH
ncbi:MAG TPA: urease accessory protein UreE [Ruminiclostridium sp.]